MDAELFYDYIERISSFFRSEIRLAGIDYDLHPIQLNALFYLHRCNRYSDTHQGVSDYFGLTKGTVSQTLKSLESKGLIQKKKDMADGRVFHLKVTSEGIKVIEKFLPTQTGEKALKKLPERTQKQLLENLRLLLQAMQKSNAMRPFGICRNCRFNQKKGAGRYFCGLTEEALSRTDIELLCREYENVENS
ncbi:MAG: MarR family transcriptional regulator [Candidatus Nitronauta litoralis]|uniref:MarR family transcriptional regulator n=1 Tax=Candidatus Nitronauta litoralis TaxID=2705533 RepID=A0A7T0G1K7_9BACT|nr:MAG: MarR family transcriptional regulator [Candidatus Nitronauta litoralis]